MTYQSEVLADAPIGYWPLTDAAGSATAADLSGNSRPLSLTGLPFIGHPGLTTGETAIGFGGYDAHGAYTTAFTASTAAGMSVEAVAMMTRGGLIVGRDEWPGNNTGRSFQLRCFDDGKIELLFFSTGGTTANFCTSAAGAFTFNQPHHVAATFNGTTAYLYVDGAQVATAAVSTTVNSLSIPLRVGYGGGATGRGVIGHVALYAAPLSAARISAHYAALALRTPGLVLPRINRVLDPSIEIDASRFASPEANLSQSAAWATAGTKSLSVNPKGTSNDTFAAIEGDTGLMRLGMVAGYTYTFAGTVNTPSAQSGTVHGSARTVSVFWKQGGSYAVSSSPAAPATGVGRVKNTVTIPAGSTEAFVRLYNGSPTAGQVVYWDSLVVEEGATGGSYFDGSTAPVGWEAAWLGAPNASASVIRPKAAFATAYAMAVAADTPYSWLQFDTAVASITATANSNYGSEPPGNAFDSNPSTNWTTNGTSTGWLRMQLSSALTFTDYKITRRDDIPSRNPKDWTFEGSNDGTTWTVLDTRTGITWPTAAEVKTFTFTNTTAYTYYRLNVTANNGDQYLSVAELTSSAIVSGYEDSSGNEQAGIPTGTLTPSQSPAAALPGKALGFGGGKVSHTANMTSLTALTVEAWVKTTTGTGTVYSSRSGQGGTGFTLQIGSVASGAYGVAGEVSFGIDGNGMFIGRSTSTARINDGNWHHVVGVWTGASAAGVSVSQFAIYIDGVAVALTDRNLGGSATAPISTGPGVWGYHSSWNTPLTATLDEAAVYTTALSASRITAHYNAATTSTVPTTTSSLPLAVGLGVSATPAYLTVSDTFNRPDNLTGLGTTSDGKYAWAYHLAASGGWNVVGNQMVPAQTSTGNTIAYVDTGLTTYTAQATITALGGKDTALAVRVKDNGSHFLAYYGSGASGKYSIAKGDAGVYTFPLQTNVTPQVGDVVRLDVTPTTITLFVNGRVLGSISDTLFATYGKVGFWQGSAGNDKYDDFSVTTASVTSTTTSSLPISVAVPVDSYVRAALPSDTFNRPDTTTGLGRSSSGHYWVNETAVADAGTPSTFRILSNQMQGVTQSSISHVLVDAGVSDGVIKATNRTAGVTDGGLVFRCVDADNYWLIYSGVGGGTYTIHKREAHNYAQVASSSVVAAAGDLVEVRLSGSSITLFVNGVQAAATTSATFQTATRYGFRQGNSGPQAWDDFSVAAQTIPVTTSSLPISVGLPATAATVPQTTSSLPINVGLPVATTGVRVTTAALPITVGLDAVGTTVEPGKTSADLPITVGLPVDSRAIPITTADLPIAVPLGVNAAPIVTTTSSLSFTVGLGTRSFNPNDVFALSLSGKARMNIAFGHAAIAMTLNGTSDFVMGTPNKAQDIAMDVAGTSAADIVIPRQRITDPVTGRAPYRLVLVDMQGTRIAELENAQITPLSDPLNAQGGFSFSLPEDDPKTTQCLVPQREVQVWRGRDLIDWYVLVRARGDDKVVTFQCATLDWYFTRRVMGLAPMPNLLKNGSFEDGERYWDFGYVKGSVPAKPPVHQIVSTTLNGTKALQISGASGSQSASQTIEGDVAFAFDSDALTSAGINEIDTLMASIVSDNPDILCAGHADSTGSSAYNYDLSVRRATSVRNRILVTKPGANVTVVGYGETRPRATNSTSAGRALNRRVEISFSSTLTAKGHRQYAGQSFTYTNPTSAKKAKTLTLVGWCNITSFINSAKDGWGVYIERVKASDPTKVLAKGFVPIGAETPRNRWTRMECSLTVPADGVAYRINVRLYPPEGTCIWDEIGVTASEQLAFYDVDEALIVKGLVEHAQDPAMGKTDLNIATRTPLTKKKRTREYPWVERLQISEALNEFPTLADGMDLHIESTATTRTVVSSHPRKARNTRYVLALGSNIATFGVDYDGDQVSTRVIVQAEGEGSDREEGVWTDTSAMGGTILEKVYNATPGSAISSLRAQAQRGIKRYSRPVVIPSVTMRSEFTDELLDRVTKGDIVRVQIRKGWLDIDALYRVVQQDLDPATDALTYTLTPED